LQTLPIETSNLKHRHELIDCLIPFTLRERFSRVSSIAIPRTMKTQLKKTLIVVAFFAAVAIGLVIGGYATSLAASSISFVAFDQGFITNFFTIKGGPTTVHCFCIERG
jgi:K+-sensing histidine kinase KdpD